MNDKLRAALAEERKAGFAAIARLQNENAALRARVARMEEALGEISTLYWVDAPAPEEMRRIARRALEER